MLFAHACSVYRATESWATFKYGPNGDFFDLCPNHASGGRIKLWCNCFCRNPMWQQHKKKEADFINPTCTFQPSKQTGLSKVLLEISSQCCWKQNTAQLQEKKHCGSVCEIWLFRFDRWEFLHRGNSWTREVLSNPPPPPPCWLFDPECFGAGPDDRAELWGEHHEGTVSSETLQPGRLKKTFSRQ